MCGAKPGSPGQPSTPEREEAGGHEGTCGVELPLVLQWLDIEPDSAAEEHGRGGDDDPGVLVLHRSGCAGHHHAEKGEFGPDLGAGAPFGVALAGTGTQLCSPGCPGPEPLVNPRSTPCTAGRAPASRRHRRSLLPGSSPTRLCATRPPMPLQAPPPTPSEHPKTGPQLLIARGLFLRERKSRLHFHWIPVCLHQLSEAASSQLGCAGARIVCCSNPFPHGWRLRWFVLVPPLSGLGMERGGRCCGQALCLSLPSLPALSCWGQEAPPDV